MRILYGSPYGPFKCWLGEEGGADRIIFLTRGLQFYLSVRAFGLRLRLHSPYPWVWVGRA